MKTIITTFLFLCCINSACKNEAGEKSAALNQESSQNELSSDFNIDVTEEFKPIDASILNSRLASSEKEMTVEEVANLLFLPGTTEGNENIKVQHRVLENGYIEAVVVHDNLPDDSILAEKFVMVLQSNNTGWKIIVLRKNWKCGRSNQSWGIDLCP